MPITISGWLKSATNLFASVSDSARIDAEVLLAKVLEKDRAYLYTWPEKEIHDDALTILAEYSTRRQQGEPIAYIIGEKEFWTLRLLTQKSTLIPRPETELIIETCLELFDADIESQILDLGTGTGAIALSLAKEFSGSLIDAVDFKEEAVVLARENASRNAIKNVEFYQSDWFGSVTKKYHLIVSNPPYIDDQDPHLNEGDVRYEPKSALVAEANGLADIAYIVSHASEYLCGGGTLMMEHGYQQAEDVRQCFFDAGFQNITCRQDLAGRDRITYGNLL